MIFVGRQPLVEDYLWWKMTFSGRRPSVENDLLWKKNFSGRWHWVEDDLGWKTTLGGIRPWVEDDLQWKTTFGGKRPSMNPCMSWAWQKRFLKQDTFFLSLSTHLNILNGFHLAIEGNTNFHWSSFIYLVPPQIRYLCTIFFVFPHVFFSSSFRTFTGRSFNLLSSIFSCLSSSINCNFTD